MILTSNSNNFYTIATTTSPKKRSHKQLIDDIYPKDLLVNELTTCHEENKGINQHDDINKNNMESSHYLMTDNIFEDVMFSSCSFDDDETNHIQSEVFRDDSYDIEDDTTDNFMIIKRSLSFDDYDDDDHFFEYYSNIPNDDHFEDANSPNCFDDNQSNIIAADSSIIPMISSLSKKQKRVQFGNVTIREYSVTVGAYTFTIQDLCPIQLGWEYSPELYISCDEYQTLRENNDGRSRLSIDQRRERIATVQDISIENVIDHESDIYAYIFLNEYIENYDYNEYEDNTLMINVNNIINGIME